MLVMAEELSNPSAPVWAFLGTTTTLLLGILGTQLKARSDAKHHVALTEATKSEAHKANKSATQAETNTANLSNGFASTVLGKLEGIQQSQQKTEEAFRKHLEWHLDNRRE